MKIPLLYKNLFEIKKYYDSIFKGMERPIFQTRYQGEEGIFAPNDVLIFFDIIQNHILKELFKKSKFVNTKKIKILEAGCGDSRGLAVASLFPFQGYGIDLDNGLVEISEKASEELYKKKNIKSKFYVTQGDYNKSESYHKLGISIKDLDYIIHSLNTNNNSLDSFLNKFSNEANKNAELILLAEEFSTLINMEKSVEKYNLLISKPYSTIAKSGLQRNYAIITINH